MADHAEDDFDGDVFVYRGGIAPQHVTHARIDKSVDEIEDHAFRSCKNLVQVETHDGIRRVGSGAFYKCRSLQRINLKSAVEIGQMAFHFCDYLEYVEFGDRLETIGDNAFEHCHSLTHFKLPSIITIGIAAFRNTYLSDVELPERLETIGSQAFWNCNRLTDIELSERLETIEVRAFRRCERLQRIAIPLKRDLFEFSDDFDLRYNQFDECDQLTRVDLVGGIHKTIASLHMESWRTEMIAGINRINQVLPNTPADDKTHEIRQWMELMIDKMDHYKAEHRRYVKEGTTLLELALWKANLEGKVEYTDERKPKQVKVKIDAESARKGKRITCGADMVIKNVIPFLQLE